MLEDFFKPHTWDKHMNALDYYLYYDEDHDILTEEMTDWTPVEPGHLVELFERGLLKKGEVFSHKGWHHTIDQYSYEEDDGSTVSFYDAEMWDSARELGEGRWNSLKHKNFNDEWA
jgi:hypothetical protein